MLHRKHNRAIDTVEFRRKSRLQCSLPGYVRIFCVICLILKARVINLFYIFERKYVRIYILISKGVTAKVELK
jgi:hypothetical protein